MPRQMEVQKLLFEEGGSALQKYRRLVVGRPGLVSLARYEIIMTVCSWIPGALGLLLRSKLYRRLLGSTGRNVLFGANVVLRHPHKIHIADNVLIDDNCLLDAKGWDNSGITIGTGVFIGRNTILSCKNGDITVGDNTMLSFNCEVFSGSTVSIGRNCEIAAYTYLIGGDHAYSRSDVPVAEQGLVSRGISVGDNVWLGAGVKVLDGVSIGRDAIVGAGAVVTQDLPDFSVAVGVPARVVKLRSHETQPAGS
ncbi:MAG: DapH/DapD/GlmU-related protein [Armatimonadota bacterium]